MASDPVNIGIDISPDDKTKVRLSITNTAQGVSIHADFGEETITPFVAKLVQLRQLLSAPSQDLSAVASGDAVDAAAYERPPWRVSIADDGDAVLSFATQGNLWLSFSMSPEHARELARVLSQNYSPTTHHYRQ